MIDWLTDRFEVHVNLSRIILCLEVTESRSLYVHIYFMCAAVFLRSFFFAHSPIEYE